MVSPVRLPETVEAVYDAGTDYEHKTVVEVKSGDLTPSLKVMASALWASNYGELFDIEWGCWEDEHGLIIEF